MSSAEYNDLKAQQDRIEAQLGRMEALFLAWLSPTIGEQNRQLLTLPKEQRTQANRALLTRKRRELKAVGK